MSQGFQFHKMLYQNIGFFAKVNQSWYFNTSGAQILQILQFTAQKMNVFIKDFFIKCDQIRKKIRKRVLEIKQELPPHFKFM